MGYLIEQQNSITHLKNQLEAILKTESLEPPEKASYLNSDDFKEIREHLARIYPILRNLEPCSFIECPVTYIKELSAALSGFELLLTRLRDIYSAENPNWRYELDQLIPLYRTWYDQNYRSLIDAAIRDSRLQGAIAKAREASELLERAKAQADLFEARDQAFGQWITKDKHDSIEWSQKKEALFSEHDTKYRELVDRIHKTLGEIGSSHQALKFQKEARYQSIAAYVWLIITIGLCWVIVSYALGVEDKVLDLAKAGVDKVWPLFAVRGVVVTIGSIVVFVCVRSYSACRHNSTVNKHRENALSTFALFAEGAHDPETKSAILMEAARAVFAAAPSGYLKAANESNASTHLVEMVRSHTSGGKSHEE